MNVAFCGLGLMGAAMVRRLLAAKNRVTVWNRSPAKAEPLIAAGAQAGSSPAGAAHDVDGVFICLHDAAAVESVVFGPDGVAGARGLRWIVDHSSIAPDVTRDLARRLHADCGAQWIDAPVSGGVAGVDAGTLAVMAGGCASTLALATPAMMAYAARVTRMGEVGSGQSTKLCNQAIVASTIVAIAEAVNFALHSGIDAERLPEALAGGWADSQPLRTFVPRMLRAHEQSIGALSTMLKDVETIAAAARDGELPIPMTGTVQQILRIAGAMGLSEAELSSVICVMQPGRRSEFIRDNGREP